MFPTIIGTDQKMIVYGSYCRFQRRLDPTYLDRFFGLAEDKEGRLVTINENKGGRVREKNDGTRYI